MGFYNEKLAEALLNRNYTCSKCGARMEFEDENEEVLVCPHCGYPIDLEEYGFEHPEDYEALYPAKEEFDDPYEDDEDDTGERYDEVCGELSD